MWASFSLARGPYSGSVDWQYLIRPVLEDLFVVAMGITVLVARPGSAARWLAAGGLLGCAVVNLGGVIEQLIFGNVYFITYGVGGDVAYFLADALPVLIAGVLAIVPAAPGRRAAD